MKKCDKLCLHPDAKQNRKSQMKLNGVKYSVFRHSYCGSSVYGLKIQSANDLLREYPFVSYVRNEVQSLVCQMEEGDIAPVHYDDIVSDYLMLLYQKKLRYNGLSN